MTDDKDITPQPCDNVYDASYCIKQTGRFEGLINNFLRLLIRLCKEYGISYNVGTGYITQI